MLTEQRKQFLLERLGKDGRVIAKEIGAELALSEDTIRRDLRELAAAGLLQRVHGGALPNSPVLRSFGNRKAISTEQKRRLGRAGALRVQAGQSVFVDGGTTNLELIKALPVDIRITLVTHSPTIAASLEHHENTKVVLIGGILFHHSMVAVGATVLESIGRMRFDLCFIGANGLHPEEGLTAGDYEEALIKRQVLNRSAEVITLITQDKWGVAAPHTICPLADISLAIIAKEAELGEYKKLKTRVQRA